MIEFILPPLLAGLALVFATGPLGCFIVWGRMAYFGDTLAHSALLGVVLGVLLQINTSVAIIFLCCLVACCLWLLQQQVLLANDTLLGILSHTALALGLAGISFIENSRINVYGLLVGDLLTVTWFDVAMVIGVGAGTLFTLVYFWRQLLLFVTDADLAKVEGISVNKIRLILMLLVAAVIAVAMQIVGVLLITALLIIPAAGARYVSSSPEFMALLACVGGIFAVLAGTCAAFFLDLPLGPAIVILAALFFLCCSLFAQR